MRSLIATISAISFILGLQSLLALAMPPKSSADKSIRNSTHRATQSVIHNSTVQEACKEFSRTETVQSKNGGGYVTTN